MSSSPPPPSRAWPTSLEEIRPLATVAVFSGYKPNFAGLFGCSRDVAYAMARSGELPTIRLGTRVVVPVPALRKMLGDL